MYFSLLLLLKLDVLTSRILIINLFFNLIVYPQFFPYPVLRSDTKAVGYLAANTR